MKKNKRRPIGFKITKEPTLKRRQELVRKMEKHEARISATKSPEKKLKALAKWFKAWNKLTGRANS